MAETHYNATADLLDRNIEAGRGGKTAYIDRRRSLTYRALQQETCRVANLLASLGVRHEDRVALAMLDTVEWPAVFLGAMRAGVVPVALNTLLTPAHFTYCLEDSRAKAVFVAASLVPVIAPLVADIPSIRHLIVVGGDALPSGAIDLRSALDAQGDAFATVATHADEPAFWLYSSGSTGMPKGVKHVHTSLMDTARLFGQGVLGVGEDDVVFSASKLFFAYGLGNGMTFPLAAGATAVLLDARPTPAEVFKVLKRAQPTIFCGAATGYAGMLADPACTPQAGSQRLRLCLSAGEALPAHIGDAWRARFGVDIIDGIGSTEMLHIYVSNAPNDVAYGTTGRPVPGYRVRLVDDVDKDVGDNEVGELLVSGPTMAEGYWNQRSKSRSTFQGDWMRTGDKFIRDSAGRYTYCGRGDDMFKVSGIWVSPFEVEQALAGHEAVLEAAVVPAKDPDGLLKPKAFIVLNSGVARDGLEDRLREHVKASVGANKYPRWIEIVEELPKTATGKIQRYKLREAS